MVEDSVCNWDIKGRKMFGTGCSKVLRKMFGTGSGRVNDEENVWNWELKGKC